MADIADDFLARLERIAPELPLETRLHLERDIRSTWGGSRAGDIAKGINGLSKRTRTMLLGESLRQGKPLKNTLSKMGVSMRTGYRMLSAKA